MIMHDIRPEQPEDATDIRALVTAAFRAGENTADFVEAVGATAKVCVAEVAVADGAIIGHAQWCFAPLIVDAAATRAAYLSSLSVAPDMQRRGIGSSLVRSGLQRLTESGYAAATLLGSPTYYTRFRFSPELAAHIETPHRSRGRAFQAIELVAGILNGPAVGSDFPAVIAPE
jgi:putative acetyltransferase